MKKMTIVLLLITLSTIFFPPSARAQQQDNDMLTVLKSSFYGGLTGALIGTAFLAFREKPGDHLKDIRVGAGVGVIIGTVYGLFKTTGTAFVEVQDGYLTVQAPSFQIGIDPETKGLIGSVDLLKIPF
ncbi:hypothetical protein MNBD_NITROSPIRAE01-2306 [hydrothermal vent metagenome]|uniref:Uncharacterized protein n=1 Tax=hydrothermal vent metagenome TaxID=652676 RepID=A0A3B1CXW6_9ZZZZ